MKNIKEIKSGIKSLQKERKELPKYSMFGTNNWLLLDAKIAILEKTLKDFKRKYLYLELREKLDNILEEYSGDFPPYESQDKYKVDTYDWLLGNTEDL